MKTSDINIATQYGLLGDKPLIPQLTISPEKKEEIESFAQYFEESVKQYHKEEE